jgi:hypothetical protein
MTVQVRPHRKIFPLIAEFFQPRRVMNEQQYARSCNALLLHFLEHAAHDLSAAILWSVAWRAIRYAQAGASAIRSGLRFPHPHSQPKGTSMQMHKNVLGIAILSLTILGAFAITWAQTSRPADVSGKWTWTTQGFGGDQETTLTLKQDGDKLTGSITGFQGETPISDGKIKDGVITFKVVMDFGGREMVTQYTAKVEGDTLKGKSELVIANDFSGKKAK